jgi:TOD1/MUCI70, glycosyltransferase-like domain
MRTLVYTAIFGGHDTLKQPPAQNASCDFICFTDSELPERIGAWQIIPVAADPGLHPRMQAKRFKLLSHKLFCNGRLDCRHDPLHHCEPFDASIWVDGSLQIKSPAFVGDMRVTLGRHDWAMLAHPDRDCIYYEAYRSAGKEKYAGLPIFPQVESYRSIVRRHSGLYACGVIVRREPASKDVIKANELWWEENRKWTYQDQLSLPYVLKKTGIDLGIIPGNLWRNQWFNVLPHESDK